MLTAETFLNRKFFKFLKICFLFSEEKRNSIKDFWAEPAQPRENYVYDLEIVRKLVVLPCKIVSYNDAVENWVACICYMPVSFSDLKSYLYIFGRAALTLFEQMSECRWSRETYFAFARIFRIYLSMSD